ncbi:MAG: F0F1 ATP synthase subunit B [Candidatus Dojkabacteria bacterium]
MEIGEVLGNIGFDIRMAFFSLINFLVVFLILYVFLFKKLIAVIDERQKVINKSVEDAERLETELKNAQDRANGIILEAKKEASTIIEQAQEEGAKQKAEIEEKAQKDAENKIAKAEEQIVQKEKQMFANLRERIGELVVRSTEKLTRTKAEKSDTDEIAAEISAAVKGN